MPARFTTCRRAMPEGRANEPWHSQHYTDAKPEPKRCPEKCLKHYRASRFALLHESISAYRYQVEKLPFRSPPISDIPTRIGIAHVAMMAIAWHQILSPALDRVENHNEADERNARDDSNRD
jgi:hypothetical protein